MVPNLPVALPPDLRVLLEALLQQARLFIPQVTIKLKWIQVWGRVCEYLREAACVFWCLHRAFPAVSWKVLMFFSLSMTLTEQEYVFCIWLRKQSPVVSMYYTLVMMNTSLCSLWQLRIYSWLLDWRDRRARECVGLWICVTHFHCFIPSAGIRFDNLCSILMWSQEDFAAAKIPSPFSFG